MIPKLSICVVTMNRAIQLKEALQSCLSCALPEGTEFIIIDNASTDSTEMVVKDLMDKCGYSYHYEKMFENIGCGGGRNYAYCNANGEYIYILDDDAVIAVDDNRNFFIKSVQLLDENPKIATLATQIYDVAWEDNRQSISGKAVSEGLYKCKMFCGGSHFLRRNAFESAPYLPNKYGYEELPPSLIAYDKGYLNVFCPDLLVIHKPLINKWDYTDEKNQMIRVSANAVLYSIKRMMYPLVFRPVIWLGYRARIKKHMSNIPNALKKSRGIVKETVANYAVGYKVKFRTVISLYKDHGISIF